MQTEPFNGLAGVTFAAAKALADKIAYWEAQGTGARVIVRFAVSSPVQRQWGPLRLLGAGLVTSGAAPAITARNRLTLPPLHSTPTTTHARTQHEMNGGWYAWSQQPSLYRSTFRLFADVIHNYTCGATMLWAPNEASG